LYSQSAIAQNATGMSAIEKMGVAECVMLFHYPNTYPNDKTYSKANS
jgi:hypothetical protein